MTVTSGRKTGTTFEIGLSIHVGKKNEPVLPSPINPTSFFWHSCTEKYQRSLNTVLPFIPCFPTHRRLLLVWMWQMATTTEKLLLFAHALSGQEVSAVRSYSNNLCSVDGHQQSQGYRRLYFATLGGNTSTHQNILLLSGATFCFGEKNLEICLSQNNVVSCAPKAAHNIISSSVQCMGSSRAGLATALNPSALNPLAVLKIWDSFVNSHM